jgi:hypothetical protein
VETGNSEKVCIFFKSFEARFVTFSIYFRNAKKGYELYYLDKCPSDFEKLFFMEFDF